MVHGGTTSELRAAGYDGAPNMLARRLSLHSPLLDEDREAIAALTTSRRREFEAREDIICQGQTSEDVHLIVSGWACRYKLLDDGRRQIIGFALPGDLCDLRSLSCQHMDHSVGALTATLVADVPSKKIRTLAEAKSRIAGALWRSVCVAQSIEREWIVNLGQRTGIERIGHMLCELLVRQRAIGLASGLCCNLPLIQSDLAEACGLSVVHVNRSLQDLRAQGLIELRQRKLQILDFDRLARQSLFKPDYLHLGDRDADG